MIAARSCPSGRRRRLAAAAALGWPGARARRRRAGGSAGSSLVAYSTPQEAYDGAHPRVPGDGAGQGRDVHPVLRRLRRPEPRRRRRPAGGRRRLLAGARRHQARQGRHRRRGLERRRRTRATSPTRSSCSSSARATRSTSQGWADLSKPGVEVITPNPFTSGGARWNVDGRLRRPAQGRAGPRRRPPRTSSSCSSNVPVQERQRPRSRCRRSPAARATSSSPTRTRRSSPSRTGRTSTTSCPTPTILIENPVAVDHESRERRSRPRRSSTSSGPGPAQKIFAKNGYRPVVDGVDRARTTSRRPRSCSPSPTSAAGRTCRRSSSTRSSGCHGDDRAEDRGVGWLS